MLHCSSTGEIPSRSVPLYIKYRQWGIRKEFLVVYRRSLNAFAEWICLGLPYCFCTLCRRMCLTAYGTLRVNAGAGYLGRVRDL